jgi:hypothetical protein
MQNKMKGKLFTAEEVQAIIAGNKTMFRTVVKNKTPFPDFLQLREAGSDWYKDKTISMRNKRSAWEDFSLQRFVEKFCLYQVGQKIFVKESFNIFAGQVTYEQNLANWKPAKHMKQEHSRLTLQIKEIRVERLQDTSADDCWKEGVDYSPECCQNYIAVPDWNGNPTPSCCNNPNLEDPRPAFAENWNAIHKKPEKKFEANPWVWSIQFEVIND